MAINEEELDLDELDEELSDQLDDEDLEPRERHTLSEIRAALRRTKGKLERAFQDGKAAGRDEEQREQAWRSANIPDAARALFHGIDPRDADALRARTEELQRSGLRWGDSPDLTAAAAEEQARMATLNRMSSAIAGGTPLGDGSGDLDRAKRIKARIDQGQGVSPEDEEWFSSYVAGAVQSHTAGRGRGYA
jgi:hypothetical protein